MRLFFDPVKTSGLILPHLPIDQWLARDAVLSYEMDEVFKSWLCHLDSMTQMIKHHAQSSFELIVLSESICQATVSERQFLGSLEHEAYIREIIMKADGKNWLFARSVFPKQILNGDDQSLKTLGNTPLGNLFFSNDKQRKEEDSPRKTIDAGLISTDHELRQVSSFPSDSDQPLYARRSLFHYLNQPVLVQEVFLPEHPIYR